MLGVSVRACLCSHVRLSVGAFVDVLRLLIVGVCASPCLSLCPSCATRLPNLFGWDQLYRGRGRILLPAFWDRLSEGCTEVEDLTLSDDDIKGKVKQTEGYFKEVGCHSGRGCIR